MCYNLLMTTKVPQKMSVQANNMAYRKDLILLLAIPTAIALIAAAVVYIPRLLANPSYDFVYSLCDNYECMNRFSAGTGRIVEETSRTEFGKTKASLYYYDATADSTKSITLEQARSYELDTSSKSPEGYVVSSEAKGGGFLFGGSYEAGWYLKNGMKEKEIQLSNNGADYYSQSITFLGWVEK